MKNKLKLLFILIICIGYNKAQSQNLIPNGDFETYSTLPTGYGQTNLAVGWNNVNNNFSGYPYGSPDYYHSQGAILNYSGPIKAYSGNGQMGFATFSNSQNNFREYLSTQLVTPLNIGQQYQITFFLTNGKGGASKNGSNNFGIHFSLTPNTQITSEPINVIPQINISSPIYHDSVWQQYNFNFIPTHAFQYITIGNFKNDGNTIISIGTSGTSNGVYFFIDKIELKPMSSTGIQNSFSENNLILYPNPSNGRFYLDLNQATTNILNNARLKIYNSNGSIIYSHLVTSDKKEIDLTGHAIGLYYYQIEAKNTILKKGKLTIE